MTPANCVTVARLGLIPFVLLSLAWGQRPLSFALLIAFLLGDVLDGYLARSRREITELGQFLDPLADKLLAFSLLVWFAWQGELNWWPVGLLLVQNASLLAGSLLLFRHRRPTVAARGSGKTAALFVALGLVLIYWDTAWAAWPIYAGVALSYWAAIDYWRIGLRAR